MDLSIDTAWETYRASLIEDADRRLPSDDRAFGHSSLVVGNVLDKRMPFEDVAAVAEQHQNKYSENWGRNLFRDVLLSAPTLGFGSIYFGRCPAIPGLDHCVLLFGVASFLRGSIAYYYRVPKNTGHHVLGTTGTLFVHILTAALLALACWSAALTWSEAPQRFPRGGPQCVHALYDCGLISSVLVISAAVILVIYKGSFSSTS